jgi:hypothetical protein
LFANLNVPHSIKNGGAQRKKAQDLELNERGRQRRARKKFAISKPQPIRVARHASEGAGTLPLLAAAGYNGNEQQIEQQNERQDRSSSRIRDVSELEEPYIPPTGQAFELTRTGTDETLPPYEANPPQDEYGNDNEPGVLEVVPTYGAHSGQSTGESSFRTPWGPWM